MSLPDKENVAIIAKDSSVSYSPSAKLFCNLCSCNLILLDPQKEEWYCNRCSVSYIPSKGDKLRRANKFETPDARDKVPIVSIVDDSNATNIRPKMSVFPNPLKC
jgi:hypothetical protein